MQRKPLGQTENVVPLVRDEKVEELLTDAYQSRLVERYTEEALSFIRAHQSQPFLLYFPYTAVHTPISPEAAFSGKSANGRFGDWVEEVDWSTGRILDTLRELKMENRTLVIFTSALSQKQIATSSANQTNAELFAQGALDPLVGDLKTEITALSIGKTVTIGRSIITLYSPSANLPASDILYQ